MVRARWKSVNAAIAIDGSSTAPAAASRGQRKCSRQREGERDTRRYPGEHRVGFVRGRQLPDELDPSGSEPPHYAPPEQRGNERPLAGRKDLVGAIRDARHREARHRDQQRAGEKRIGEQRIVGAAHVRQHEDDARAELDQERECPRETRSPAARRSSRRRRLRPPTAPRCSGCRVRTGSRSSRR